MNNTTFDPESDPDPLAPYQVQARYFSLLGRANLEEFLLREPFQPFEISVDPGVCVSWAGPSRSFRVYNPNAVGLGNDEVSLYDEEVDNPPAEEDSPNIIIARPVFAYFPVSTITDVRLAPVDTEPEHAGQWVEEL